jgi:hypothetical protein
LWKIKSALLRCNSFVFTFIPLFWYAAQHLGRGSALLDYADVKISKPWHHRSCMLFIRESSEVVNLSLTGVNSYLLSADDYCWLVLWPVAFEECTTLGTPWHTCTNVVFTLQTRRTVLGWCSSLCHTAISPKFCEATADNFGSPYPDWHPWQRYVISFLRNGKY